MSMMGFIFVPLIIAVVLSGPVALIISIIALKKIKEINTKLESGVQTQPVNKTKVRISPPVFSQPSRKSEKFVQQEPAFKSEVVASSNAEPVVISESAATGKNAGSVEQRIGTRWILIAGIVTSIVGVGFFLKYAYDNGLVGPLGRVMIASIAGLTALGIGEVTRRRGYDVVAKGMTALGFAILYVAIFSAFRFYGLIGPVPAFAMAILITVSAMLYAVALDEIIIAFFSLFGGFLTPVIVTTGENQAMALFSYVLVLGVGAIVCAYYRKWRLVSALSFVGTYALYDGWFEKFYRPVMAETGTPEQIAIALGWLAVFFTIYLVLPVLYGLIKRDPVHKEDVMLVVANTAVTFYYLWTILFVRFRTELAFCAIGLCVAHLILLVIATKRFRKDLALRLSLLVTGLFFLTIALPLYLKMYALAIAWAVEGIVLTIIGLHYRSILTQTAGTIALILSVIELAIQLPMHRAGFNPVFNPAFASWCFSVAAFFACHMIYRKNTRLERVPDVSQFWYVSGCLLLFAVMAMEWHANCMFNVTSVTSQQPMFIKGLLPMLAVIVMLLVLRPMCPEGIATLCAATLFAAGSSIFTSAAFNEIYHSSFTIFANIEFVLAALFILVLFVAALHISKRLKKDKNAAIFITIFTLAGIVTLWVVLSSEIYLYWHCRNLYATETPNWRFLANMYTSIAWAVYGTVLMVLGFWLKNRTLRYTALGLFAVLLVKIFIMDMSTVRSVYRIAAFLATGLALVAVSYLYQHLKKKGFFEIKPTPQNSIVKSGEQK